MIIGQKHVDSQEYFEKLHGPRTFGDLILCERLAFKLKKKDMAEKLGIGLKTLDDMEKNKVRPSLEFAKKAAKKLGHHPNYWQTVLLEQIKRENPKEKITCQLTASQILKIISQSKSGDIPF